MAKKRKSLPPSATDSKMDLDDDHSTAAPPLKNPVLSANTRAGITKSVRLPRGKGRRAQRQRKVKGAERAEEVQARTERKVERSRGKGRRKGERNAAWEELNKKIKGAVAAEVVVGKGKVERLDGEDGEGEWEDEAGEDGVMLDVEGLADGEEYGGAENGNVGVNEGETAEEEVDGGIL
ncbi:MAG: hypothetical protein Q9204_002533 [Flavoplaca sp. TL-2023a]